MDFAWTAAHQAPLSSTLSQSLLKFMAIESVMPSNHLILCYPLLLLPSIFISIRVFSNESALCTRWPKSGGFSFSNRASDEYSGLISFGIDWCLESRMEGLVYFGISGPAPVPATQGWGIHVCNRRTAGRRRGGHGSGLPRGPSVTSGPCGPHMEDPEAERDCGTCPGSHSWSELGTDLTLN